MRRHVLSHAVARYVSYLDINNERNSNFTTVESFLPLLMLVGYLYTLMILLTVKLFSCLGGFCPLKFLHFHPVTRALFHLLLSSDSIQVSPRERETQTSPTCPMPSMPKAGVTGGKHNTRHDNKVVNTSGTLHLKSRMHV